MSISLVIPIKQLANAKRRLSTMLSADQRCELFKAMVEDVLEVATSCDRITEVIVVTKDPAVSALAYQYSAIVMPEPDVSGELESGLIAAVTQTAAYLAKEQVKTMVFLPGDVPLITVEELEVVLDGFGLSDKAEMMIVPANDLGGSNCLVCSPPDCMSFGFGEDSFRRHLRLAKEKQIEPMVAKLPGIGLDIDTPADLIELAHRIKKYKLDTHTSRYLADSAVAKSIDRSAKSIDRQAKKENEAV
ncbi:MAG: 2-phospho-L-lactate guanylyltransferase [Pseudomonadales bacterium]|nr:2-phospho-L-lactate guanylyltransferase [Pseudomonadales bacterium]